MNPTEPAPTAKSLAAAIRAAIRSAQGDGDPVLSGLKISVTSSGFAGGTAVAIRVRTGTTEMLRDPVVGGSRWTDRAYEISARARGLAAPALAWEDGRSRFCEVTLNGLSAPVKP